MRRLLFASLLHYIAQGAKRPRHALAIRLSSIGAGICLVNVLLLDTVSRFNVQLPEPSTSLWYVVVFAHSSSVLVLLCSQTLRRSKYTALLASLSLPPQQLWLMCMLPACMLLAIYLAVVSPAIQVVAQHSGIPPLPCLTTLLFGSLCAFGQIHPLPHPQRTLRNCLAVICLALELLLLKDAALLQENFWQAVVVGIMVGSSALLAYSAPRIRRSLAELQRSRTTHGWLWNIAPWFSIKAARNKSFRHDLYMTFGLSLAAAISMRNLSWYASLVANTMGAVLAASCATGIRPLSRKDKPCEITGLKGVGYFRLYTAATYVLIWVALAPLFWLLWQHSPFDARQLCSLMLYMYLGITCGNLAGSLIVPDKQNISGQCLAVFASTSLLWLLGKSATFITEYWLSTAVLVLLCILLELCTHYIEHKRNPFYWRET
jgi:hypothetical protein